MCPDSITYTGFGVSDYLAGQMGCAALSNIAGTDDARWDRSVYGQDSWKLTPRLTINAGLSLRLSSQGRQRSALSLDGANGDGFRDRPFCGRRLCRDPLQQHHGLPAVRLRFRQCSVVCHLSAGHVLEAHDRARCFRRIAVGNGGCGNPPGLALPVGAVPGIKGGWLAIVHVYPSEMAENFWTAIWAWSVCFGVTILVSLLTEPRREEELVGLVYSLTERISDRHLAWYKTSAMLGIAVLGLALILNIVFR